MYFIQILETILEEILRIIPKSTFLHSQLGFEANKSTQNWIFTLWQILEKIMCTNRKSYIRLIDTTIIISLQFLLKKNPKSKQHEEHYVELLS